MISSSMQAISKSRLINYLTPKIKKIRIKKAETLFRNLPFLPAWSAYQISDNFFQAQSII